MNYNRFIIIIAVMAAVIIFYIFFRKQSMIHALTNIKTPQDALALFPKSPAQAHERTAQSLAHVQEDLEKILAIPDDQRTYANTIQALDILGAFSNAVINAAAQTALHLVHPDEAMRKAADAAILETQNFFIEHVSSNRALYLAVKGYAEGNAKKEPLIDEQKYFLQKVLEDFEREGLNLAPELLDQVKKIRKELAELGLQFDKNIAQDNRTIAVDKEGLTGLSDDFLATLKHDDVGNYIVGIDFPTYLQVMENCTNADTRQNLFTAYMNRAYPGNKLLLEQIIAKRFELARLLGFQTYAEYELADQMVETPGRAQKFIKDVHQKALAKAKQEFVTLTKTLPQSVTLAPDGNLYPWDTFFIKNQYKKTALNLDENIVAQYFPMQSTVDALLKIYQDFFNLEFKQLSGAGLWDADVRFIEVIDKERGHAIGYLFLDLHPRPNKFNHACEHTIVPVTYDADGKPNLGVVIVVANFPKARGDKPALLQFKDVTTFFHEFGHAMHALLGRTKVISFAGTNVKWDFVEMPSQMLEEWMWDPEILKLVSKHYQTGQPLPDDLIAAILKSRTYDSGSHTVRQLFLATLSLNYFNNGPIVDIDATFKNVFQSYVYKVQYEPFDHMYASFGHLIGYGARYYGYMWSSVFAHDLAHAIKKEGFLNPAVGKRYKDMVIGKGGSKDPNELLKDFLGREPNQDAFLHDLGL